MTTSKEHGFKPRPSGAVLPCTASETEAKTSKIGIGLDVACLLGGTGGDIAEAYTYMGAYTLLRLSSRLMYFYIHSIDESIMAVLAIIRMRTTLLPRA
jgi:hypothetical protein